MTLERRRLLAAALTIVAIGSAAYPRPGRPSWHADRSAGLNARTAVPKPVMSVLRRACFDCHSNETRWPWYARVPIASHLIERDVRNGRAQLDWSQWEQYNPFDRAGMLDKVCDLAATKQMPPWQYRLLHSDARLSPAELDELCAWTRQEAERLTQRGS